MHQKCQDALALCARFGKPHLFITGTTNPTWAEITRHLRPGQSAHDRSEITNRVFHMKLNQIINLIEKGFFYQLQGRCHSIEWQKRGLTHFHLIVWFQLPDGFIFTPHHVDNMISAELPPDGTVLCQIIE